MKDENSYLLGCCKIGNNTYKPYVWYVLSEIKIILKNNTPTALSIFSLAFEKDGMDSVLFFLHCSLREYYLTQNYPSSKSQKAQLNNSTLVSCLISLLLDLPNSYSYYKTQLEHHQPHETFTIKSFSVPQATSITILMAPGERENQE